jgi:hypothetical protein
MSMGSLPLARAVKKQETGTLGGTPDAIVDLTSRSAPTRLPGGVRDSSGSVPQR